MKATIEFTYHDYATLPHHSHFTLVLHDDEGKEIFATNIGSVDFPKEIIQYEGEEIKTSSIYNALYDAKTEMTYYWEE